MRPDATTARVSAAPIPTAAQLTLAQLLPPAVLPVPATRPAGPDRPPLEALALYAQATDNLLKHRRLAATGLLEKAVALDPDSFELHSALARAYLGNGGSDERSIAELERAAEIDPDHVELQTDLGRQYLARGDNDKALWHLRLALATSDYRTNEAEAAVAELFAGRALARAGYHTAALEVYGRLVGRLQSPSFALRGDPEVAYLLSRPDLLRLQVADSFERVGMYEQALRAYEAAAAHDPDDAGLRAKVVRTLLALGRADDAIARAADGVARGGASPASLDLLRQACEAAGRKGEVVEQLRRLRRQRPRDAGVVFALADVLRGEGRAGEAMDLLAPLADASPPRGEAVRRIYACAADTDATGVAAARFLVGWSARHPEAVHLLAGQWDDLVRPTRQPRVRLTTLKGLTPERQQQAGPGWEAAKWFWVAQVARLRHRNDVARDALRRCVQAAAVFAPAYRAASGVAGLDLSDTSGSGVGGDEAPYGADELAARAEAAWQKALGAELRGLGLLARKQFADARRQLEGAVKLGGTSPDLHFARAVAARGAGDDAAFESILWKLVSDWPGYSNAYEALYAYHASRGADAAAVKVLASWLAADRDNVTARLFQAREFFRAGRVPAGEHVLEELMRDHGDVPTVLAAARSYYTQAGRIETFVTKLREAVEKQPANVAAAAQLADVLAEQHKPAEAARVLDGARAAAADDADLLYEVAHLYGRVGQKEMTEQVLRDVLAVDPGHASAANDLGYTLADEGRELDRAEALVRRAVEGDPGNASFLDSLGWVLYKRGRFADARDALVKAVETSAARGAEPDPVVLDHLGDALYRAGDAAAAAGRWKEAADRLAATPNAGERDDLKALRLQLDRKTRQSQSGQPVSVAPVAVQEAATGNRVGSTSN